MFTLNRSPAGGWLPRVPGAAAGPQPGVPGRPLAHRLCWYPAILQPFTINIEHPSTLALITSQLPPPQTTPPSATTARNVATPRYLGILYSVESTTTIQFADEVENKSDILSDVSFTNQPVPALPPPPPPAAHTASPAGSQFTWCLTTPASPRSPTTRHGTTGGPL